MLKLAFIVGMCVSGIVEWLKNLLPAKVKDNNVAMSIIAGVLAACIGFGATFVAPTIFGTSVTIVTRIIFAGGTVALTQTSYMILFKTFTAVKERLMSKVTVDPDKLADEIADKVVEEAEDLIKK